MCDGLIIHVITHHSIIFCPVSTSEAPPTSDFSGHKLRESDWLATLLHTGKISQIGLVGRDGKLLWGFFLSCRHLFLDFL